MTTNCEYWIRHGQHTAIALIHGIGAKDPPEYWRKYLDVLVADPGLQDCGIFVWGYSTHVRPGGLANIMSALASGQMNETAPEISHLGTAWGSVYLSRFKEYQQVFLICHEMGGLVVKAWILDLLANGQGTSLENLRHIAFYATPHGGASIARLTNWNKQLQNMSPNSPFIAETSQRWFEHVVKWQQSQTDPADARYYRFVPHLVIAALQDQVVSQTSARIQGMPLTTVSGNHAQCIQPPTNSDTRYKTWRDAFTTYSQPTKNSLPEPVSTSTPPGVSATAAPSASVPTAPALSISPSITPDPDPVSAAPAPSATSSTTPDPNPAPAGSAPSVTLTKQLDFFISYTANDQTWAEWIAFQLEDAGYTTYIQAWDIRQGTNFLYEMNQAATISSHTIAVLSPDYLNSQFGFIEWAAALRTDPTGIHRRLLPVRVKSCDLPGLLGSIVYVDLVDLSEQEARERLIAQVKPGRRKPSSVSFPGPVTPRVSAPYPGSASASLAIPHAPVSTSAPAPSPSTVTAPSPAYHSVVLSYAPEDATFAVGLATDLKANGVPCLQVEQDLHIGDHISTEVSKAILKDQKLLLILSQNALVSRWVEETIDFALDYERKHPGAWLLFPLRLDEAVMEAETWWAITVRQRLIGDFREWQQAEDFEVALQRVLRDLRIEGEGV
jgi:hypothetical protein